MTFSPLTDVLSTLVITAHPDDVDFGLAGSVAKWIHSGTEVAYCIVTDGDAGGFDPGIQRADIPSIRRAEQRAAAEIVGVSDVEFLGYHDGSLAVSMDLRRDLSAMIRRYRPERVVLQSPTRNYMRIGASHPDHMAAGEAALEAVYPDARNPFAHLELAERGLEAHIVSDVAMMAYPEPTHYVDVTDTVDLKIAALMAHKSQLPDPARTEEWVRAMLFASGEAAGLQESRSAELFFWFATA